MDTYVPLEDRVNIEAIVHTELCRLYDPTLPEWDNSINAMDSTFSALTTELELKRMELPYAEINNFPSLQASHQICKKVLGDLLRKELPLAAEAEKYLQLKIWGRVKTPSGHVEREQPCQFKRIPAVPDEVDRKIQAEMLRRGIKWP